ncbi:MAG: hypothetical protein LC664_08255, partial [Flavobacteriales bacterium]|nr:hypothetical protein [Flavobacteriales bacterium]
MKAVDINTRLIDNYVELLKNFSTKSKLDLISKLTQSMKSDVADKKSAFDDAYGAWDENDKAEELVSSIREARSFN